MTNETNHERSSATLWPYTAGSGIIDHDLARSIRQWALSVMSEADLNKLSQRQALRAYIDWHIIPTIDRVMAPMVAAGRLRKRTAQEAQEVAQAAFDSGELYGFPLDPRAREVIGGQ